MTINPGNREAQRSKGQRKWAEGPGQGRYWGANTRPWSMLVTLWNLNHSNKSEKS